MLKQAALPHRKWKAKVLRFVRTWERKTRLRKLLAYSKLVRVRLTFSFHYKQPLAFPSSTTWCHCSSLTSLPKISTHTRGHFLMWKRKTSTQVWIHPKHLVPNAASRPGSLLVMPTCATAPKSSAPAPFITGFHSDWPFSLISQQLQNTPWREFRGNTFNRVLTGQPCCTLK